MGLLADIQADPCNQWLLTPFPVLRMYAVPTTPTVEAIFKDVAFRITCCDHLDSKCD